jgi:hypothetical protein
MFDLPSHPITRRLPASPPERRRFYSGPSPLGVEVSITLKEIGLGRNPDIAWPECGLARPAVRLRRPIDSRAA